MLGHKMHEFAKLLWPINRSITGDGVRATLKLIKSLIPRLTIHEVPTGTKVFDWVVPKEWRIRNGWIITPSGQKICDFQSCNLHIIGYSAPVNRKINLSELNEHLYSLPQIPNAIPYVTSYYQSRWGFCISHQERDKLQEGEYHVFIDSELFNGSLTYGELIIPGKTKKEIFLSTYICHPSMANNELSGPVVTTFLAKWLCALKNNRYTYRVIFIPETIGSLTYLSQHLDYLKSMVVAGFNITCVGDNRGYSYLPTRAGDTLSDIVAKHVLSHAVKSFKNYTWSDRGSDERQYNAPHIDLPIASIMRSKYGTYDEYHTSLDDLFNVVTPEGLHGAYIVLLKALEALEHNCFPRVTTLGEPQLGRRGLYSTLSTTENRLKTKLLMDFISWSDGTNSLLTIAQLCNCPIWDLYDLVNRLVEEKLLTIGYSNS